MKKLTHTQMLGVIETTYLLAEKSFDKLYAAATTQAEKDSVKALYSSARDVYWKAVKEELQDGNDVVDGIVTDLGTANANLKKSLQSLQSLTQTLGLLTEAVRLAASLATLAAA